MTGREGRRVARIFYSMAGEGRGHATRVRAAVEELRADHELTLFAPGDAHELLAPVYAGTDVEVRRLPGLRFCYTGDRLNHAATAWEAAKYLAGLPGLLRELRHTLERERPDLVVTDFEPALPRAAKAVGVPFVSLDHQHFLTCCELSDLPAGLRRRAKLWALATSLFYSGQEATIVSGFHAPPVKPGLRNVATIGPLLRPAIVQATPSAGGGLLVYWRRFPPPGFEEALRTLGRPATVYGLGARPPAGPMRFRAIDDGSFVDELAACDALLCTAGNQLVGEALFLGKPVLAFPEANNREQAINAHFLRASGGGEFLPWTGFTAVAVAAFLARAPALRSRIDRGWLHGNAAAVAALQRHLPARQPAAEVLCG